MAKKRQTRKTPDATAPINARIAHLLRVKWQGNKSQMGREVGFSQPVIARVVAGQQEPPGRLIEALAQRADVNLRWLLLGEGEPSTGPTSGAGGGRFCPVAPCLLPGTPQDYPQLLGPTSLPVAEAHYSPTAYWFATDEEIPFSVDREERAMRRDHLFVETGEALRPLSKLRGRLCVWRHPEGGAAQPLLGWLSTFPTDPFEKPYESAVRLIGMDRKAVFDERPVEGEAEDRPGPRRKGKAVGQGGVVRFRPDDVVGVVLFVHHVLRSLT